MSVNRPGWKEISIGEGGGKDEEDGKERRRQTLEPSQRVLSGRGSENRGEEPFRFPISHALEASHCINNTTEKAGSLHIKLPFL